jgi:hypothetical protein
MLIVQRLTMHYVYRYKNKPIWNASTNICFILFITSLLPWGTNRWLSTNQKVCSSHITKTTHRNLGIIPVYESAATNVLRYVQQCVSWWCFFVCKIKCWLHKHTRHRSESNVHAKREEIGSVEFTQYILTIKPLSTVDTAHNTTKPFW